MKTEEIGTIGYGNLTFIFHASEAVNEYLIENSIEPQMLFPKTQFFYQGVLMKLGISHEEEKELKVVFHGIRLDGKGVTEIMKSNGEHFDNFPIHVDDLIYLADFFVEVKDE